MRFYLEIQILFVLFYKNTFFETFSKRQESIETTTYPYYTTFSPDGQFQSLEMVDQEVGHEQLFYVDFSNDFIREWPYYVTFTATQAQSFKTLYFFYLKFT